VKALREKYFYESEKNATDFVGWKPDEVYEVPAKTWESVDVNSLPSILMIGIYQIKSVFTDDGEFTSIKLNDRFDFPVVRNQTSLIIIPLNFITIKIWHLTSNNFFP
jgi:hypothetical protein